MRKRWMVLICFILITILVGWFFTKNGDTKKASDRDLDEENFLDNKEAIVYFSTTADQDTYGGGKSAAVFIDHRGKLMTYEMEGLELGSIGVKENEILLVDKSRFYKISKGFKRIERDDYQHTGDHLGFLEQTAGFYAVFNSGYDKTNGGYRSDFYWEKDGHFEKGVIPFFIEASVLHQGSLYTLSSSEDEKSYQLNEVILGEEPIVKQMLEIEKEENSTTFGQLQTDGHHLYFIRQTGALTEMVKVNLQSKEYYFKKVAAYANDEQTFYKQIPFSYKRCVFLYQDNLYFIDGFGDVYRISTKTGNSEKAFSLLETSFEGSLEVFPKNGTLYVFSLEHENRLAKIEGFNLLTGKKQEELVLKDFPELNTFNTKMHLYDFVMIHPEND
ncbi:hypothetical protein PZE06_18100 [Robertmurraya sp. DFI.2.37]|uniref:hypothetical protein n=1 Tax=Robertmurraya sp. DFI.2.37 TaxID=3031819 RepID=UPI0023DA604C|nr:hypothetical protein [Robertmurraya sp. DFI.2.37]MDF1510052.1 hypothetical protein [Robertmurraya sp. DFI.2.37]